MPLPILCKGAHERIPANDSIAASSDRKVRQASRADTPLRAKGLKTLPVRLPSTLDAPYRAAQPALRSFSYGNDLSCHRGCDRSENRSVARALGSFLLQNLLNGLSHAVFP